MTIGTFDFVIEILDIKVDCFSVQNSGQILEEFLVYLRVSVQGVKSLGDHFACLCQGFQFYGEKKIALFFQKENGNTFTLLIIFIVKSLQKEQNTTNLLL